ncbi:F420-0--gamma-glutamyl ligase [Patescibacteria group bacterium]|nr:F420-0--gamma-glutamyl ligase [Patescibacteria group bacterium]MBU4161984.1 F420-0--gamma-glutamyl ligase [Patescibacteria group bacterium]
MEYQRRIMEYQPNQGKELIIKVDGKSFARIPVKTHFITNQDNLDDIIKKYILEIAQPSDIVMFGQKVVAIIQNRIVYKKDIKLSFWAKYLSKFATKNPAGPAMGDPYKMQVAINTAGLPRILFAGATGAIAKLFGISGTFYRLAGNQVNQIDGFCDDAFNDYLEMGVLGLKNCDKLCDEIKKKYNFSAIVADINDIGGNILGMSSDLKIKEKLLLQILKDNPLGQKSQSTPIGIIREITN